MNTTLDYYNEKAEKYFNGSVTMVEASLQDRFLSYLPEKEKILDFGCGSGRDSLYFLEHGYSVVSTDGSEKLAAMAEEKLHIPVKVMEFNELDEENEYDGIFACASIMHLEYEKLLEVIPKMIRALKPSGILYVSFKYGEEDGYLGKRYYTYMTEERFTNMISKFPLLEIISQDTFTIQPPDIPEICWLEAFLKKK